jgi:hypothetical protein
MNSEGVHATPKVLTARIVVEDATPKFHITVKKVIPENDSRARTLLSDIHPSMLEVVVCDMRAIVLKIHLFTA